MMCYSTLSITVLSAKSRCADCRVVNCYPEFHYAACRYAECRGADETPLSFSGDYILSCVVTTKDAKLLTLATQRLCPISQFKVM